MKLTSLDELIPIAKSKPKRRVAVCAAFDEPVLSAVYQAFLAGFIQPILIGNASGIRSICTKNNYNISSFEIIDESEPLFCAKTAVSLIKQGNADILMKGNIPTALLLRAVLDKEQGLRNRDLLSHFALIQTQYYHKLIGITDAGMNISPNLKEKITIIENAVDVFHNLGISLPKVAVLGPLETVNEKIASTVDASELKELQRAHVIKDCLIDGPLALDNAVSKEAAEHKGITSEVAGDADILLVPDLNSGNILYKSIMFLSDGVSAAIITGATVPIVLTSRADSEQSKLYSLALASVLV